MEQLVQQLHLVKNGKDNDVYIYDATGKVFYAKGYYVEGGVYYSDKLTQDGPIIDIEKNYDATSNTVELVIRVEPEITDENMVVRVNNSQKLTKESD